MPEPDRKRTAPAAHDDHRGRRWRSPAWWDSALRCSRARPRHRRRQRACRSWRPRGRTAVERIYFDADSATLPAQAADVLARTRRCRTCERRVAADLGLSSTTARSRTRCRARGADEREAVAHALEANGVAPDRLIIVRPVPDDGGRRRARNAARRDPRAVNGLTTHIDDVIELLDNRDPWLQRELCPP